MDRQHDLDVQLAVACLMFLPHSMRGSRIAAMLTEAMRNPDFARELQEHPRTVFDRRCGHIIEARVSIEVHFSTADSIHLVLPSSALAEVAHAGAEITDEDLLSHVLKSGDAAVGKEPPGDAYVKPRT